MKKLFIDTSHNYCLLILEEDQHVIDSFCQYNASQHSETTVSYIETLLQQYDWQVHDLTHVLITNGPGSFIGTRTCATIVKTWMLLFPKLVVTVVPTSLFYLGSDSGIIYYQATKKMFYFAVYQKGNLIIPHQLLSKDKCEQMIGSLQQQKVMLITNWNQEQLVEHYEATKQYEKVLAKPSALNLNYVYEY